MSNLGSLDIGEIIVVTFSNYVPQEDELALHFIFKSTDKRAVEIDQSDGALVYPYITSVKTAKERLDSYNLTTDEIDKVISGITDIPLDKLKLIMVDMEFSGDEFEPYTPHHKNVLEWMMDNGYEDAMERERIASELTKYQETEEFDEFYNILDYAETGTLLFLRRIRRFLDNSSDNAEVRLDVEELETSIGRIGTSDEKALFAENIGNGQKLNTKYLNAAKVHFSQRKFDLVYIESIIAVEYSMNILLMEIGKEISKRSLNIDSIVKRMSLNDLLKFIFVYLKKQPLPPELEICFERTYNKRNNILHNGNRSYDIDEVYKAIYCCEKIIELIQN